VRVRVGFVRVRDGLARPHRREHVVLVLEAHAEREEERGGSSSSCPSDSSCPSRRCGSSGERPSPCGPAAPVSSGDPPAAHEPATVALPIGVESFPRDFGRTGSFLRENRCLAYPARRLRTPERSLLPEGMEEMSARMGALGERKFGVRDRQPAPALRAARWGTTGGMPHSSAMLHLVIPGSDRCAGL
jgi:hypothetical protein